MKESELAHYLHKQIPASKLLEVTVEHCSQTRIELTAPIEPNINHKNTVFGGSLSVLAILAGWSLVYMHLNGRQNEIVIQESSMSYVKAAEGDFSAVSVYETGAGWERFDRSFTQKGRGRIKVESQIICEGEVVATFSGTYVAFNKEI